MTYPWKGKTISYFLYGTGIPMLFEGGGGWFFGQKCRSLPGAVAPGALVPPLLYDACCLQQITAASDWSTSLAYTLLIGRVP
jgi:hypothetical protein